MTRPVSPGGLARLVAVVSILALGACGDDKNVDDWKREQANADLAELETIAGVYSGSIRSASDGETIGSLRVTLKAESKVASAADGSRAASQAVLVGEFALTGANEGILVADDGAFDPETQTYLATVAVPLSNGKTETISISGTVVEGRLEGRVEALGYGDLGGRFSLARGEPEGAALVGPEASAQAGATTLLEFHGTTVFSDGAEIPVTLTLLDPREEPAENFACAFIPERPVQLTLSYGETFRLAHLDARWDRRNSTLLGTGSVARGDESTPVSIDCRAAATGMDEGWVCEHFSAARGKVALTRVSAGQDESAGWETRWELGSRTESYAGTLESADGPRAALLSIHVPRRSLAERIAERFFPQSLEIVEATLRLGGSIEIAIRDARLDRAAGSLSGSFALVRDGGSTTLSLDCSAIENGWDCRQFSSALGAPSASRFIRVDSPPEVPTIDPGEATGEMLSGEIAFTNGLSKAALLDIRYAPRTQDDQVTELFFPRILDPVRATLDLGHGALQLPIRDAVADRAAGRLTGFAELPRGGRVTLECARAEGWICRLFTLGRGLAAELRAPAEFVGAPTGEARVERFRGSLEFGSGTARPFRLNLRRPFRTEGEIIEELFLPRPARSIEGSLVFGEALEIPLSEASLDDSAGRLVATYALSWEGETLTIDLDCVRGDGGWDCGHLSGGGIQSATSRLVPSDAADEETEAWSGLGSLTRKRVGLATFPDGSESKARLVVTRPERTKEEDLALAFFPLLRRTLEISVAFEDGGSAMARFADSRWDPATGRIEGEFESGDTRLSLRCADFSFQDAQFRCEYRSNRLDGPVRLHF